MIMFNESRPADMANDPLYRGAYQGAQNAFGNGTSIHDPHTVATEVFENSIAIRDTIKNPFAFGRTLGFRRATSYLRRAKVEERYLKSMVADFRESDECSVYLSIEERDLRETILFQILGLSCVDSLYVFLRNYCEFSFSDIKAVIDAFTGESVSVNTHRTRYEQALARFKRAVAEHVGD